MQMQRNDAAFGEPFPEPFTMAFVRKNTCIRHFLVRWYIPVDKIIKALLYLCHVSAP
jgi:hypothetical protein